MAFDEAPPRTRVTIVVTQRERVSAMKESLASLYANTAGPFELVYVTGRLSAGRRRWLNGEALRLGFAHVEAARRLTPAEARNIGARRATTEYVLFVENDVVFTPGWLDALVACADQMDADVVAPITCEGRPLHSVVHYVGTAEETPAGPVGANRGQDDFHEEFFLQGSPCATVAAALGRRRTQLCELHCFMTRPSLLRKIDYFDPQIVSKEYLDFSWSVTRARGQMWIEPASVVTFLIPSRDDPVRLADLPDFLLRWSGEWQRRSHDALRAKWGLQEAGYITRRRSLASWRIVDHLVKPALEKAPFLGRRWGFVERGARLLYPPLAAAASLLAHRHARDARRAARREAATADA